MDLSTFIVAVFCLIDDRLKGRRIRQRGPAPKLSDAEVPTMEIVGEFLGIDTDKAIFLFFQRHYSEWFPALDEIHRTTFAICFSMPLPACLFARPYRCERVRGEAAFGKDTLLKQTFYGFRVHVRICWPGLITRISVAPANAHELSVVPEIVEGTRRVVIGDRNYHSPRTKEELLGTMGVQFLAPSPPRSEIRPRRGAPC